MNARWQKILVLGWLLASAAWLAWAWPRSLALALGGWAIAASTSLAWLGLQFVLMRRINRRDATPAAGRWALLRAWWLEALTCTWVFGWLQPFAHRQQPDWLPPTPTGQRGVVLVHGFLCNRGVWLPWLPELRARGHAYVALTLEPAFGSVDDYVAAIDTAMRQVQAATGLPPVLVGHSMGGLAARAWLRTLAQPPAQRVHRILTLGTPHHGTWPARFSHTTTACKCAWTAPGCKHWPPARARPSARCSAAGIQTATTSSIPPAAPPWRGRQPPAAGPGPCPHGLRPAGAGGVLAGAANRAWVCCIQLMVKSAANPMLASASSYGF